MKRGGPLKRTGFKQKSRKPMAAKGVRQKRLDPAQKRAYAEVDERSGGFCEAGMAGICRGVGVDHHHRGKQSVWPELKASVENIVLVCRSCHDWIDAHQQAASELDPPMHLWRNVANETLMGLR